MKFQPEHFPVGTIFEVAPEHGMVHYKEITTGEGESAKVTYEEDRDAPKQTVFTALFVMRAGPTNYIVVTSTRGEGYVKMNQGFHLSLIKRIVQPSGAHVVVRYDGNVPPNWHYEEMSRTQQGWGTRYPGLIGHPKSHYIVLSYPTMMMLLMHKFMRPGPYCLDVNSMGRAMGRQSFVHQVELGQFHVSYAPKKRLNAWFKANVNRFLTPVKEAQRQHDVTSAEEFYDLDEFLERRENSVPMEDTGDEGSCYDVRSEDLSLDDAAYRALIPSENTEGEVGFDIKTDRFTG